MLGWQGRDSDRVWGEDTRLRSRPQYSFLGLCYSSGEPPLVL